MSSEPKAVGYVNGDGLNELKAGKAAGITVGIYSETLPRTTPLYDEQALSALRTEVEKLSALRKHHRARHKSYKRRFNELSAEVEALRRDAERFRWLQGDPASRNLLDNEWPWCVYIDRRDGVPTMMPASGANLAAAVDAAMEQSA